MQQEETDRSFTVVCKSNPISFHTKIPFLLTSQHLSKNVLQAYFKRLHSMLGNCFLSSRLIFKPSHQSTAAGSLLFYLMDDRRAATPGLDFVLSPVYWKNKVNTVKGLSSVSDRRITDSPRGIQTYISVYIHFTPQ